MAAIKLGYAPTRRSIFSAPDAIKYRGLTADRLRELGIDFVDIDDINEEGLLYDDNDVKKIVAKFRKEGVDGIIFPHCNFGTEYVCARLAKEMNLPVMLWGPLDERPEPSGVRLRDTQCGLFATGKVFRRFRIPFTYVTNCRLNDPVFERGVRDFMAVCNVVKTFRHIRILQISTRPFDFWSTMCNEGELLEKFNIQLSPIPMTELTEEVKAAKAEGTKVKELLTYIHENMEVKIKENEVESLYCMNPQCQAKRIKAFTLFVSRDAMNVEGLSEATLEKLIARGFIHDFGDIFELERYREQITEMEGLGEKSFDNLVSSIEKARDTTLPKMIYSLGIPNIGLANAKVICRHFDYDLERLKNASEDEVSGIDGIGPVIAKNLVRFLENEENQKKLEHLVSHLRLEKPAETLKKSLEGLNFVITGSVEHFPNRNAVKEAIEEQGGKVTGTVTSKTSYLINNDTASSSSKNKKAKALGVPIISEEEFLEMLNP